MNLHSLPIPSSSCACCVVVSGTSRSMLPSLRLTTMPSGAAASASAAAAAAAASAWSAAEAAAALAGMLLAPASVEGPVRERERKSVRRTSVADLARGGGGTLDMMQGVGLGEGGEGREERRGQESRGGGERRAERRAERRRGWLVVVVGGWWLRGAEALCSTG
ncbi:hypothetical protein DFP73DRAFT_533625 [Morchella snyderi]|nr:hypothetical protein DFP73DRAFT_533625 [Morchella snyderi]